MKSLYLAGVLPLVVAAHGAALFGDSFDRADSRNIQASLTGITDGTGSGFAAGTVYTQPFLDPNNRAPIYGVQDGNAANGGGAQILANNLQLAVGAGTSNLFVNHNFTDAAILTAGGFSVSLDVLAYSQATNAQGAGFAVGMSSAEAGATADAFNGVTHMTGGFGPAIGGTVPAGTVSDFWVVIRGDNTLAWGGRSGTVQGVTALPAKTGTLSVKFSLSSFAAGSVVTYQVLDNGVVKGSGSFTWSKDSTNYIGIDTRDAAVLTLDNFLIETLPLPTVPPYVDSFEATRLIGGTKDTRFHWNVVPGEAGDPFTVTILNGATVLNTSTSTTGFVDVNTSGATSFKLKVANAAGSDEVPATVAAGNNFATAVRADAPAAWYRFNGSPSALLVADSANGAAPHDGVVNGGVFGSAGAVDGAGNFNGTSGSVLTDLVFNPATLTSRGFTVESIVRRTPTTQIHSAIVSQTDGTGTGRSLLAVNNDGTIESFLAGGAAQRKAADVKLASNTWAHLVMVVDTVTPEIRWYLDGTPIGSSSDGKNPDGTTFNPAFAIESATGAWRIGTQKSAVENFWSGDMDEVAIYPTLLDDPDGNGDRSDSRVAAHSSAWLSSASGLLGFSAGSESIAGGESTTLSVKVAANVTSVTVDNGVGSVTPVNGVASISVHPAATTTYTVTTVSPAGTQTQTVTITVTAAAQPLKITSSSIAGANFVLNFTGAPATTYNVRGSADLVTFGTDLGTATTDAGGIGSASIPIPAATASRQFYRIETKP